MPIGIPKVPFRIPGDEEASWVDLYNGLYRSRALFLGQEVDYEVGNHIAGLMIFLSIEDPTKDLFFFINSPGGLAVAGLVIYDTMQFVTPHVYTLGLGVVASMGSFLLVGGENGKRLASPNSRIMIHQPASSYTGKDPAVEVFLDSQEVEVIRQMVLSVYVQRTGQPKSVINDHLERNIFMTPTEAKEYGIIDGVGIKDVFARIRDGHPPMDDSPNPTAPDKTTDPENWDDNGHIDFFCPN